MEPLPLCWCHHLVQHAWLTLENLINSTRRKTDNSNTHWWKWKRWAVPWKSPQQVSGTRSSPGKKCWAFAKVSTNHLYQNNRFYRKRTHKRHKEKQDSEIKTIVLLKMSHIFKTSGRRTGLTRMSTSKKITRNRTFLYFTAGHQSNARLFPRTTFILLFVTEVINSHLAHYCPAWCRCYCNYTILSFSAVSDACREDFAGSPGRLTSRGLYANTGNLSIWKCSTACSPKCRHPTDD